MYKFFEKLDVFSNILFDETIHKYTLNGQPTISVTKIVGNATPPFDEIAQSERTSRKRQQAGEVITAEEVRAEWKHKNRVATEKGTAVHKYIECAMANKFEYYPEQHVRSVFGGDDPVKEKYDRIIGHVNRFMSDIRGKMYPVKSEVVIGSPKYMVCGMVDQMFYNVKSGKFEIWDWKTNSEFTVDSRYYLLPPVGHLMHCKLDEYSLQLACYKRMFQEMTGIELGNCYLCWFSELQDSYKVMKCKDLDAEAKLLLERNAA